MATMVMSTLILKRPNASRSGGPWSDDDYDVLESGVIVGRIFVVPAAPKGRPWMWVAGHGRQSHRAAHRYAETRAAAMAAFANSWRRI